MQASRETPGPLYSKNVQSANFTVSRHLNGAFSTRRQMRLIACLLQRGHDGQELREILGTNRPWTVVAQLKKRGFEVPSTRTIYLKKDGSVGWRTTYRLSATDRKKLAQLVHDSKTRKWEGGIIQ